MELTINSKRVSAEPGMTIYQAAKKANIYIPALCYHEALSSMGSCRLCIVELTKGNRTKIVTSCNYPVEEGIKVVTDSERVLKNRRMIVELLLARCPEVKIIQDLAQELGVKKTRFRIDEYKENCILCGLCVRVCEEVVGVGAINFLGRGKDEKVDTPFHRASDVCIGCGACVTICPTGCIKMEDIDGNRKIDRWQASLPLQRCKICGKPVATRKHLEQIKERFALPPEILELCPDCKRNYYKKQVVAQGHL